MNDFFYIKENTLKLEGVHGIHKFLHISDTHAIYHDEFSDDDEIAKAQKQEKAWDGVKRGFAAHFSEPFNSEHNIPSYQALHKLLEYAKQQKPEKLLLSGDIIDYLSPANMRLLTSELDGCKNDIIYTPGNHEGRYDKHPELQWLNNDSVDVNIYNGDGFIIASVDDSEKTVSDIQLETLRKLANGNTPVILLMHIPVGTDANIDDMKRFEEYYVISNNTADKNALEFLKLLTSPDSAIKAILCGHVHGYHISYFAEGRPQICASSGLIGFVHSFTVTGAE